MEHSGNEFLPGFVEHLVPLREKKALFPKKAGIVLLALFLAALILIGSFSFLKPLLFLTPFLFFGEGVLIWYLWRFTSIEFEYTILPGEMDFEIIYGQRQRRKYYTVSVKNMEKIAPVNGKEIRVSEIPGGKREVFCASTRTGEGTWYAVVKEEDGSKTLLFFDLTSKGEKALRFQNARAFF